MIRRHERGIRQRRYWEHTIRDDWDFAAHLDYIHFNPVTHGLIEHPAEWPHFSFGRCVAGGCTRRGGCAAPTSRRRRVSGRCIETAKGGADRTYQIFPDHIVEHSPIRRRQSAAEGAALFRPTLATLAYHACLPPKSPHRLCPRQHLRPDARHPSQRPLTASASAIDCDKRSALAGSRSK